MEELKSLVERSRSSDVEAFGQIVRRFQDMACGYAFSILGDFHLAEDAAQEAFIEAYRQLPKLRDPDAFPGWFRRVVFKHCDRIRRRRRVGTVSLEAASDVAAEGAGPVEAAEQRELRDTVLGAIRALPEHQRTATALFYINGYSQQEIAEFLDVPATTVKKRLYDSRRRLKERMLTMVDETLKAHAPTDEFPERILRLLRAPKPLEIQGHPVREVWEDVRAAFEGWQIVEGTEIESASAFRRYLRLSPGKETSYQLIEFGDRVLRATTTSTIIQAMSSRTPPFKVLCAGRVFRDDGPNPKHYPIFHQVSGAHVGLGLDEEKEVEELRLTLEQLAGSGRVAATEHEYPFVRSRGWELYIEQGDRRQNVAGAGLLLPEIVQEAGLSPKRVQAFAFGFGLEALAIWRMQIDDIRKLWRPPYVPKESDA